MALTPEEEAELAELEAEFSQPESPSMQTQPSNGFWGELAGGQDSTLGNVGQWGSDIWDATKNAGVGAYELAKGTAQNINPSLGIASLPTALGKTLYKGAESPLGVIQRTGEIAQSIIPGTRTAATAITDTLFDELKPSGEYGKMLREDLSNLPVAAAGVVAPGAIKGMYQAGRDFIKGGIPKANVLAEAAPNAEIYANTLNAGRNASIGENKFVQRMDDYHQEFTDANPVAGIDPSTGREGFLQFKQNLDNAYTTGVNTRSEVLKKVSEIEAQKAATFRASGEQPDIGVPFKAIQRDISLPDGRVSGLSLIENTMADGALGVQAATEFVQSKFGITPEIPVGTPGSQMGMPANPGRSLSATELNDLRMAIDGQLRGLEAYDINTPHPTLNPSALQATAQAFKHYRGQIDSLLKDYIRGTAGEADALAFDKAGGQIGMAKTYKVLADRFQAETGQGFTPGSGKSLLQSAERGSRGLLDRARTLLPGENTQIQTATLKREATALRDLQTLIGYNNQTIPKPAPRGLAQIRSSVEHLNNIGSLAMALGLIGSVQELTEMPDELAKNVIGQVAAQVPQAFVPTPDRINVIDDQYQDPFGKDLVISQSLNAPAEERAMRIGGTYNNRYVPSAPPAQAPQPPKALPLTMEKLNRGLGSVWEARQEPQMDTSYDGSLQRQLEQLTEMKALHESDIQ